MRKRVASKIPRCLVQTVRMETATNGLFVEMIAAQTLRAWGTLNQLAKKPEVDLLLRLAGTSQISRAIERVGARKGEPYLLVMAGPKHSLARIPWKGQAPSRLQKRALSESELEKIEAAALLNAERG